MAEIAQNQIAATVNSMSIIDSVDLGAVQNTLSKINQFQMVVQNTLKKDHDFGIIPGTAKPTLLKPGAEKILMLMGLTSKYEVVEKVQDYEKGFFAFTVKCELYKDGLKITEGLGHCNTKEPKYHKRKDGTLQDPYGYVNTVLKMAKKRAQIDATLTVASLSEVFTQDIEDMQDFIQQEQTETMTAADAAQTKVTFGKFKGKTLKDIYKTQPDYLNWLHDNAKSPVIKKAIEVMWEALKEQKQYKQQNQQSEKQTNEQPPEPSKEEAKQENPDEVMDELLGDGAFDIDESELPFD